MNRFVVGGLVGILGTALTMPVAAAQAEQQSPTVDPAAAAAPEPAHRQKLTLNGQAALWTVAIKPDGVEAFERVMARLRDALAKSEKPEQRQQAAGWRLWKADKAMPDGNIVYVHVIDPVVPGADYSVMQALYEAFPNERQALYDLYRNAFATNLSLATGSVVLDMSKAPQTATAVAP